MALAGAGGGEERQLPPLLPPPTTALSGQEDPEQIQALRMKVQVLTVTALLLVLLCSAPAPSEALQGRAGAPERQPGAGGPGEAPWPPGNGGDNLPGQGSEGSRPPAGAWKVMGEVPPSSGSPSKPRRVPAQPSGSRRPRLSHHLKGHGKFNGDTHSCHGIQSRPCQRPSDCGGCLGLYTCEPPARTCHLKAVSRRRGGFLQSIQSPEGRGIPLIPEKHGSM